jgi:hypothetical protein
MFFLPVYPDILIACDCDQILDARSGGCNAQCDSVVFQTGIIERWIEIRTSTVETGWVLSYRSTNDETWDSGDFGNLCAN